MNFKKLIWINLIIVLIATPIYLAYATISESKDCSQLVIDTYELHSGINIPKVKTLQCFYDLESDTRISVYQLEEDINLSRFESTSTHNLNTLLLNANNRPDAEELYVASGKKWDTQWTYAVDVRSNQLWAELRY